jgi:hypothetical protein
LTWATAVADDYKPELFSKTKPVYADSFDGGMRKDFWEVRQETTWTIENGVLSGKPASVAYQEKKKASGDAAHAGLRPVIWLKQIPENFICTFRVRFDGQAYQKGFPLIDIGHHISQPLTRTLLQEANVVLCMTESHRAMIQMNFDPVPIPVYLFREFMPQIADQEIADPYGGSLAEYEACRDEMVEAIPSLVEFLKQLTASK